MSTEYRRGIPSTPHVEAATRLGLLWHRRGRDAEHRTRFVVENGQVLSDYGEEGDDPLLALGPVTNNERHHAYYCIRPDGTPVDWEVLDQEVARVGQQGQPQGFRATLFGMGRAADFLARWTVYQELKPLYDLVDGAQGEAAMPRDVEAEWDRQAGAAEVRTDGDWSLYRNINGFFAQSTDGTTWFAGDYRHAVPLRNFAAVLDAVAERRVAERMREQTQAPTVTSAQPEPRRFADVRPDRHGWRWWRQTGRDSTDLGQRFETLDGRCRWRSAHADAWFVPDTANPQMLRYTIIPTDEQGNPVSWESIAPAGTVQSVNSDGTVTVRLNGDGSVSPAREGEVGAIRARWAAPESFFSTEPPTPPHLGQFSNNPAMPPLTPGAANLFLDTESQALLSAMQNYAVPGIHITVGTGAKPAQTEAVTTLPLPLPRFTADELDDVDHSCTTKLDEVTLRRGKLPTVEQIAKYREVRAKRTGGTVADALKESRIDCEVAQYVLERWAGGLGDVEAKILVEKVWRMLIFETKAIDTFVEVENAITQTTLDTTEPPDTAAQQARQQAEERRQRLAQVQAQIAAERATAQPQEMAKESAASRFDLIEPDPQADPAASIRAWEARQAAAKVRPTAVPPRIAKPTAARRPAIEVVDAEVDGLSRVDVVTALVGRAFNGGC